MITLIYLNVSDDEDEDDEEDDDDEEEDDILPTTMSSQRCNLSESEQGYLLEITPLTRNFTGLPFVIFW
jgi:hypothetical protein